MQRALVETVACDLDLLEKANLKNAVSISEVKEDGSVTYEVPFEGSGIVDYIQVAEDSAGNVVLNIREGTKENELIYMTDGRVILDDYEVTMDTPDVSNLAASTSLPVVAPRAGAYTRTFGISLPHGTSSIGSMYTYKDNYQGPTLSLGQAIGSIALSVLISVVTAKFKAALSVAIGSLTQSLAAAIITDSLSFSDQNLALLATTYSSSDAVGLRAYEYALRGNDSLYSEWIYAIDLIPKVGPGQAGSPHHFGAKKITQAT